MSKLKTLNDLKMFDDEGVSCVSIEEIKTEAMKYVNILRVPNTPEYDKIKVFFHCSFCLKNNSKSGAMEVGYSQSVSKIIIQCKNCKRSVKIIDLAENQREILEHLFNIVDKK